MDGPLPGHAYVPGLTPRHPEGSFDAIRETVRPAMTIRQLAECDAFRLGLRYIDEGYFWEAHELLEPVWMALPDASDERRFVQGLIQIANGFLKVRMRRPNAARRLAVMARSLVHGRAASRLLSVDAGRLESWLDSLDRAVSDALKCNN